MSRDAEYDQKSLGFQPLHWNLDQTTRRTVKKENQTSERFNASLRGILSEFVIFTANQSTDDPGDDALVDSEEESDFEVEEFHEDGFLSETDPPERELDDSTEPPSSLGFSANKVSKEPAVNVEKRAEEIES